MRYEDIANEKRLKKFFDSAVKHAWERVEHLANSGGIDSDSPFYVRCIVAVAFSDTSRDIQPISDTGRRVFEDLQHF